MCAGAKKQENYQEKGAQSYAERPHVLVVDDDARIRELVVRYLSAQEFVVLHAKGAAEARDVLDAFEVDAIVLDVMMPGETGFEFLADFRERGGAQPVIMLTALGEVDDRVQGLEAGADDYLPKPFEPRELVARLKAVLKRVEKDKEIAAFDIGDWRYDPKAGVLVGEKEEIKLTEMDVRLLNALAGAKGAVMSREDLAAACDAEAGDRNIDVQVTRLRKKIEADTKAPRYLQTVRGKGYVLRL